MPKTPQESIAVFHLLEFISAALNTHKPLMQGFCGEVVTIAILSAYFYPAAYCHAYQNLRLGRAGS